MDTINKAVAALLDSYKTIGGINHRHGANLPSRNTVIAALMDVQTLIFPGFRQEEGYDDENLAFTTNELAHRAAKFLCQEIERSLVYKECHSRGKNSSTLPANPVVSNYREAAMEIVASFFYFLPALRSLLLEDVESAFSGDPAAKSIEEVILAYPGLEAIVVYRIAHFFWKCGVPLIPRIMCEYLHSKTGIDIHPGAEIGVGVFIDHGTGVVIGETAILGNNIRLYQGVTLGALSVQKEKGQLKRHPTIEDDVTIYSGATILGGSTTIGRGSIIGGNVWLVKSVPPFSRVYVPEEHQTRIERQFLDRGYDI